MYTENMKQTKETYSILTKYGTFSATIWHEKKEKLFLVELPDFDHAMTQGTTLVEARRMAKDLLEILCESAFDDGKAVIDNKRRFAARGKLSKVSGPATVLV